MYKLLFALTTLALVSLASATPVTPHTVVVHAGDQQFWIARVNTDASFLDFRLLGQDDRWQPLCKFESPIDAIASQGSTAAVLLRDKTWAIVYSDRNVVSAGALPASALMLALAGNDQGWWAIGQTPGGLIAATTATRPAPPATRQSAATTTTAPSTAPATGPTITAASPPALVLFHLTSNTWMPLAELPGQVPEAPHVALSIIEQVPYVALADGKTLTVFHLDNARWVKDLESPSAAQIAAFKFLGESAPPRLWVQHQTGPDSIFPIGRPDSAPMPLNIATDVPAKDRDVALFGRSIRAISRLGDKLIEQRFNADTLKEEDKPAELGLSDTTQLIDLQGLHTLVAIVSLMLVLLGWFRQQAATEGIEPNLESVTLAPMGRRFAAGLIDASPVVLTMIFFLARHAYLPNSVPQSRQFLFFLAYWSAGLFYILHTTLIETYTGRSLGKIMLGLRVVTLQGQPPDQAALFSRNALRIFDLSLFFFPIIFVPFAPFHQRSGDLVAGTVVILDQPPTPTPEPEDKDKDRS